jgi:hypothetical protein
LLFPGGSLTAGAAAASRRRCITPWDFGIAFGDFGLIEIVQI